jgi:hypothetical protein
MGSSLVAQVRRASRAEGERAAARSLCADLAKQHHAKILPSVAGAIEACPDAGILHQWALAAPRASDEEFARLVQGRVPAAPGVSRRVAPARTSRGRAARPSRRAKPAPRR